MVAIKLFLEQFKKCWIYKTVLVLYFLLHYCLLAYSWHNLYKMKEGV